MNREDLYKRINERVDRMMSEGLLEEVRNLWQAGYGRELVSMQGIGYKEFFDYFEDKISLEETVDQIKKDTRHFAKRQLTWFRREREVVWINKGDFPNEKSVLAEMLKVLKIKGIYSK